MNATVCDNQQHHQQQLRSQTQPIELIVKLSTRYCQNQLTGTSISGEKAALKSISYQVRDESKDLREIKVEFRTTREKSARRLKLRVIAEEVHREDNQDTTYHARAQQWQGYALKEEDEDEFHLIVAPLSKCNRLGVDHIDARIEEHHSANRQVGQTHNWDQKKVANEVSASFALFGSCCNLCRREETSWVNLYIEPIISLSSPDTANSTLPLNVEPPYHIIYLVASICLVHLHASRVMAPPEHRRLSSSNRELTCNEPPSSSSSSAATAAAPSSTFQAAPQVPQAAANVQQQPLPGTPQHAQPPCCQSNVSSASRSASEVSQVSCRSTLSSESDSQSVGCLGDNSEESRLCSASSCSFSANSMSSYSGSCCSSAHTTDNNNQHSSASSLTESQVEADNSKRSKGRTRRRSKTTNIARYQHYNRSHPSSVCMGDNTKHRQRLQHSSDYNRCDPSGLCQAMGSVGVAQSAPIASTSCSMQSTVTTKTTVSSSTRATQPPLIHRQPVIIKSSFELPPTSSSSSTAVDGHRSRSSGSASTKNSEANCDLNSGNITATCSRPRPSRIDSGNCRQKSTTTNIKFQQDEATSTLTISDAANLLSDDTNSNSGLQMRRLTTTNTTTTNNNNNGATPCDRVMMAAVDSSSGSGSKSRAKSSDVATSVWSQRRRRQQHRQQLHQMHHLSRSNDDSEAEGEPSIEGRAASRSNSNVSKPPSGSSFVGKNNEFGAENGGGSGGGASAAMQQLSFKCPNCKLKFHSSEMLVDIKGISIDRGLSDRTAEEEQQQSNDTTTTITTATTATITSSTTTTANDEQQSQLIGGRSKSSERLTAAEQCEMATIPTTAAGDVNDTTTTAHALDTKQTLHCPRQRKRSSFEAMFKSALEIVSGLGPTTSGGAANRIGADEQQQQTTDSGTNAVGGHLADGTNVKPPIRAEERRAGGKLLSTSTTTTTTMTTIGNNNDQTTLTAEVVNGGQVDSSQRRHQQQQPAKRRLSARTHLSAGDSALPTTTTTLASTSVPTQMIATTINAQPPTKRDLLSPMDFVWRATEARALSCTEATLSGGSSTLAAQLAASTRSKSLCTDSQRLELKRLNNSSTKVVLVPKRVHDFGQKVGRLTRNAINHIKRLSASNPNMDNNNNEKNCCVHDDNKNNTEQNSTNFRYRKPERRASSQRAKRPIGQPPVLNISGDISNASGRRKDFDEIIVPHQLNRFVSTSSSVIHSGGGGSKAAPTTSTATTSAASRSADLLGNHSPSVRNHDDVYHHSTADQQRFYSSSGVYIGPGGICSWQDVCPPDITQPRSSAARDKTARSNSSVGTSLQGTSGATSWLSRPLRSSVAQALLGTMGGSFSQPTTTTTNTTTSLGPMIGQPVVIRVGNSQADDVGGAAKDYEHEYDYGDASSSTGNDKDQHDNKGDEAMRSDDLNATTTNIGQLTRSSQHSSSGQIDDTCGDGSGCCDGATTKVDTTTTTPLISHSAAQSNAQHTSNSSSSSFMPRDGLTLSGSLSTSSTNNAKIDHKQQQQQHQQAQSSGSSFNQPAININTNAAATAAAVTYSSRVKSTTSSTIQDPYSEIGYLSKTQSNGLILYEPTPLDDNYTRVAPAAGGQGDDDAAANCGQWQQQQVKDNTNINERIISSVNPPIQINQTETRIPMNASQQASIIMSSSSPSSSNNNNNTTQMQTKSNKPWILNLTQRVHYHAVSKASPPQSNRASQKQTTNRLPGNGKQRVVAASEKGHLVSCDSSSNRGKSPHLAKEARSNSLSGLYHTGKYVDLSKSSMDLNYSHQIVEQTNLYLTEMTYRYSGSSHELTPKSSREQSSDHWFRRSSKTSQQSGDQQQQSAATDTDKAQVLRDNSLAAANQQQQQKPDVLYGANLQTICVHCQLIAELANHPASSYLAQLLSASDQISGSSSGGDVLLDYNTANRQPLTTTISLSMAADGNSGAEQNEVDRLERGESMVSIRPSVVLTVCSNQATLDDDGDVELSHPPASSSAPVREGSSRTSKHLRRQHQTSDIALGLETSTATTPAQQTSSSSRLLMGSKGGDRHKHGRGRRRRHHRHRKNRSSSSASLISRSSAEETGAKQQVTGGVEEELAESNIDSSSSESSSSASSSSQSSSSSSSSSSNEDNDDDDDDLSVAGGGSECSDLPLSGGAITQESDDASSTTTIGSVAELEEELEDEVDYDVEEEVEDAVEVETDDDCVEVENDVTRTSNDNLDNMNLVDEQASKSRSSESLEMVEYNALSGSSKGSRGRARARNAPKKSPLSATAAATTAASAVTAGIGGAVTEVDLDSSTKIGGGETRRTRVLVVGAREEVASSKHGGTTTSAKGRSRRGETRQGKKLKKASIGSGVDNSRASASASKTGTSRAGKGKAKGKEPASRQTSGAAGSGDGRSGDGDDAGQEHRSSMLEVPVNKQARSASLDAPYLLKVPERHDLEDMYDESYPGKSNRSHSVDISLPTRPGDAYLVRQTASQSTAAAGEGYDEHSTASKMGADIEDAELIIMGGSSKQQLARATQKKFIQGEIKVACANGETRALKLYVNWRENCVNGEHLWIYVGSSSEACYVGENECLKHGPRLCCSACKITAHTSCISILIDKIKFICKHTFKDLTVNNSRHVKENVIYHHWVHKRTHCGRCKQCTKTFGNTKLPFSSKEIQAITCSWCKVSYHNKENCYTLSALTEPCTLGAHRESIIPPPWILKLPIANTHQQHNNGNGGNQSQDMIDLQPSDNLIDLSMTNQAHAFKSGPDNNNKENSENLVQRHQHSNSAIRNNNQQHQSYGSNTTLMTDTSGYTSADGSNVQSLMTNNSNNNKMISDHQEKIRIQANYLHNIGATDISEEIIIDPTALQAADLSIINQTQGSQPKERHQHPQESMSQFQKHQLRQYQRQIDGSQNSDHTKLAGEHDSEETSILMDLQLTHQQQVQSPSRQPASGLYQNFRIVPQPIQGVPNAGSKPVLVFVNPRSGGNQGAKMMQKFNWLLNPRQVFDLIQSGGPRAALELYRDVPNLRILTIGGDGTASWILSYLDEIGIPNKIPVAVLPLGTGNDLARALGWGGGYADEPIAKILTQVRDGEIVQLDRWNLQVERNFEVTPSSPNEFSSSSGIGYTSSINMEVSPPSITSSPSYFGSLSQGNTNTSSTISIIDQTNCDTNMIQVTNTGFSAPVDEAGSDRLPMDVINNYFSFGVDAHIALEFHTAREAHPERFNSRLRNKMFYGQAGGKDLLKRKWKDLSNFVTLYCDGQDMTSRLKELKVHSVLFLNISSYGGGTRPWPTTATSFAKPRTDDGLIEVIGLTTYQLPLLQAGGHGTCIAQCRNAKIITSRTIPMQVDGEPCKLLPSIINISFKNRVCMLARSKSSNKNANMTSSNIQKIN